MTSLSPEHRLRPYALVLLALIIGEATGAFESAMLTVAIPKLIEEFQVTTIDIGYAVTGFFLVSGAAAGVGGRLGDLFGRRRMLIAVLLLSVVGSLISVGFGTFPAIIVGRAIQGVSGAVLPLLMGLVRESVTAKRVPTSIAVVAGTVTIAGALGFFVAGILIDNVGWHAIFVASAILAVVAAAAAWLFLAPSPRLFQKGDRIDLVGALLFVPALALVLVGVSSSRGLGWLHPVVLGCIVVGVALGAFWAWWELRNASPMLNLRMLKDRKFALTMAMIAFYALGPFGGFFLLQPVLLQYPLTAPVGLGLSATLAGLLSLVLAVVGFAISPLAGSLAGRRGAKTSAVIGLASAVVLLPLMLVFRDNLAAIIAILFLQGVTGIFAITAIPNLIAESVPAANMAEGSGFYVVVRSIFQSASTSVVALLLSTAVVPGTQFPEVSAFGLAMALMVGSVVVSLVCALLIKGGRPSAGVGPATVAETAAVAPIGAASGEPA